MGIALGYVFKVRATTKTTLLLCLRASQQHARKARLPFPRLLRG